MDLTALYTTLGGIIFTALGVLGRQLFIWLNSKNIFRVQRVKQQLLDGIARMSAIGIAVANQEFVDRLRSNGLWKIADENLYQQNIAKALEIATKAVKQLLTIPECKLIVKLFGVNEKDNIIKSIILEQLSKSKNDNINNKENTANENRDK